MDNDDIFDSIVKMEDWEQDVGVPFNLKMTPHGVVLVAVMEHIDNFTMATTIASDIMESLIIHGYEVVEDGLDECM